MTIRLHPKNLPYGFVSGSNTFDKSYWGRSDLVLGRIVSAIDRPLHSEWSFQVSPPPWFFTCSASVLWTSSFSVWHAIAWAGFQQSVYSPAIHLRSWARSGKTESMKRLGVMIVVASNVFGKCLVLPVTR